MQLADHTFLITGAASGLGRASAERFARGGARVVLADVDETGGQSLAATLGSCAQFVRCDVADEQQVQDAISMATTDGPLHAVVHCAGVLAAARVVGKSGPHDLALFAHVIQMNLVGTFNMFRLAAAAMTHNPPGADGERGVLIATSSVAAEEGQIGQAAYAASKAGVSGLVLPLARELARFGIRVIAIAPGVFDTEMMAGTTDERRRSLAGQIPFPWRFGQPDEFASLAQHIVENRYLNGRTIRLDAGLRLGAK